MVVLLIGSRLLVLLIGSRLVLLIGSGLSCLVLLVLYCLVLSCIVLCCSVLWCLVLSCLVLPCIVLYQSVSHTYDVLGAGNGLTQRRHQGHPSRLNEGEPVGVQQNTVEHK